MYVSARLLTEAKSFIGNELNASCRRLSKTHSLLLIHRLLHSVLQWTNKRLINSFRRIVNDNDCDGLCVIEQFVTQSKSNGYCVCVCVCSIKIVKIRNTLLVIWRVTRWRWAAVRSASTLFFSSFKRSSLYCILVERRWFPGEKVIHRAKVQFQMLPFSVHKINMNLYRMKKFHSIKFFQWNKLFEIFRSK